jgi:hypothetical protein
VRFCNVVMLLLDRFICCAAGSSVRDASMMVKLFREHVSEVSRGHTAASLSLACDPVPIH